MERKINTRRIVAILLGAVLLAAIVGAGGAAVLPRLAQQAGEPCIQLYTDGRWSGECPALVTETPIPPTATMEPTPTLAPTSTSTATAIPPTPTATATPIPPTVTPEPVVHDLNECHHPDPDNGVYHDHGTCWDELPAGSPIRAWVGIRQEWQGVGLQPHSSLTENLPYDEGGKHPGYNKRYIRFETCEQFGDPGGGSCLREIYFTFHSVLTPKGLRTAGGEHSANLIAVVCPVDNFPASCEGGDRIIAMRDVAHYGEPHAQYKTTYCRFDGAIEYVNPDFHVSQPPYWAQNLGRGNPGHNAIEFISSLRNAVMISEIGRVNNLFQWTLSSRIWGFADATNEDTCGLPENDTLYYTSTNPDDPNGGMAMKSVLWTLFVYLDEYPRPFVGFTDRIGDPAPTCTEISFDCAPIYVGIDVPPGNVFFNNPVRNDAFRDDVLPDWLIMDVTRPDTYAPGLEP